MAQEQEPQKNPTNAQSATPEEPVRVNHTARNIIIALVVVVLVVAGVLVGVHVKNSGKNAAKGTKDNPVVIGVIGATDKQWPVLQQKAEEQGIYVTIQDFQDYAAVDKALAAGQIDLNEIQHILYLANFNEKNNTDLQPIGGTQSIRSACIPASTNPLTTSRRATQSPSPTMRQTKPVPSACSSPQVLSPSRVTGPHSPRPLTSTPTSPR